MDFILQAVTQLLGHFSHTDELVVSDWHEQLRGKLLAIRKKEHKGLRLHSSRKFMRHRRYIYKRIRAGLNVSFFFIQTVPTFEIKTFSELQPESSQIGNQGVVSHNSLNIGQ